MSEFSKRAADYYGNYYTLSKHGFVRVIGFEEGQNHKIEDDKVIISSPKDNRVSTLTLRQFEDEL